MNKITFSIIMMLSFLAHAQSSCSDALLISAGEYQVGIINGTAPTLICAQNGAIPVQNTPAGVWYQYVPAQDVSLTITTSLPQNSGRDTRFHIYSGLCSNLVCVGGDDDSGDSFLSFGKYNLTAGVNYTIVFDNRWGSNANNFIFQLIEGDPEDPEEPELPEMIAVPVTFNTQNVSLLGTYKNGAVDMNGDFLDDRVSVSANAVYIQYQNVNGTFNSVTIPTDSAENLPTWSLAVADYDGNGHSDLLYGGGSGVTFMKANDAGTAFTKVTFPQYVFSQRSNFVDINQDGHLDAFVCHDVQPNVFYLNDGEGNFTFNQGGIGDVVNGGNYGSIWTDYNNDGFVDLFIAKCRGAGSPAAIDELHRNDGGALFTNTAPLANMNSGVQTWSAAWGDFNNDGWMDALIGASSFVSGGHRLMLNNGDGTFTDVSVGSGFDLFTGTGIEYIAHDFNNDGFVDVHCAGSGIIMYNNGNMTFSPVSSPTAGAIGDLNNDGFLDIMNGNNIRYNNGNNNNWIKFNLQGVNSNRQGIGARVEIHGTWGIQIRDVRSGEGFRYMNTINPHFGIGNV
ncbi:MAG: FG-GAP repeat domain-containing protein, partial [Flavobacterium sp.]